MSGWMRAVLCDPEPSIFDFLHACKLPEHSGRTRGSEEKQSKVEEGGCSGKGIDAMLEKPAMLKVRILGLGQNWTCRLDWYQGGHARLCSFMGVNDILDLSTNPTGLGGSG